MKKSSNEGRYSFLEGKWVREQVEGHILFGLYIRPKRLLWVSFLYLLYFCIYFIVNQPNIKNIGLTFVLKSFHYHLISLALIIYFAYVSNFSQSAIFWLSTKITFAFMSFILFLLGFVNMLKGNSNWLLWMILGVVWIPSFEFSPTISKHQKKLDIFRLLVTVTICTVFEKEFRL